MRQVLKRLFGRDVRIIYWILLLDYREIIIFRINHVGKRSL